MNTDIRKKVGKRKGVEYVDCLIPSEFFSLGFPFFSYRYFLILSDYYIVLPIDVLTIEFSLVDCNSIIQPLVLCLSVIEFSL